MTQVHEFPEPEYIEFVRPGDNQPEEGILRLELWEAEQFLEETHEEAGQDPVLWVRKTREKLKEVHQLDLSLEQTDYFIRVVRSAWDEHKKKDTPMPELPSGMDSPPEATIPTGEESS